MLSRNFKFNEQSIISIPSSFVRILQYAAPAWSPYQKNDIAIIEKIIKRATKLVPCLKNLLYDQILKQLTLTTLKIRRLGGDLIQYFKFDRGINIANWQRSNTTVPAASLTLRGPSHRLRRQSTTHCNQTENLFLNRIVPLRNDLPEAIIHSTIKYFNCLQPYCIPELP